MNIEEIAKKLEEATLKDARALELVDKLIERGFPHANCRAHVQLTQANSLLCRMLKKDAEAYTLDVHAVEERGLVLGIRQQRGHKSLYEWDKVISVE